MARQPRIIKALSKIGGSNSALALTNLKRMTAFVRESFRSARVSASIATAAGHRWLLPEDASFLKYDHPSETNSLAGMQTPIDGS